MQKKRIAFYILFALGLVLILMRATFVFNKYNTPNNLSDNSAIFQKKNLPDTAKPVITTSFKGKAFPLFFEAAFLDGTKAKQGELNFLFSPYDLGKINVESGKLINCDPIVMFDAVAFTQEFPIGHYPVQLAIANGERVALSRILFSNNEVVRWEYALKPGQKPITLKDSTFYFYPVDASMAIFIDEKANSAFVAKGQSFWEDVFVTHADRNGYKGFIQDFDEHNLAAFYTGYGDGRYATYIGFDSEGKVCRLLTDFGLVEWWKLDEK